ncbi:MAG: DUF493 family protein [Tenacibaculum sp.]
MVNKEAFYNKLRLQLENTTSFPTKYLYKFIVPTTENQVQEVRNLFDKDNAVISTKKSKTGKYISLSVQIFVNSPDEIILYYKKAEAIKGIISL